ncbi:putative membrane protein [Bacteroides uniformis str. 3978 T3 i]|uniref:Putative membrane protein n=1 Tax=Bacteroides uniformis str. 3978 T3 ii TaxID=1339349 RepID=A0A078RVQ1_BACUN|nr:putative membrane protein [Bacteroides uniformis str. 3978 T3 ii]KDS56067.1 putative membrane protein [Bacteroides uniformis str. 3978 T3 ii]KDS60273.1 putative membrane protein [Bacteroides uniformis str. 3978 T3 i]
MQYSSLSPLGGGRGVLQKYFSGFFCSWLSSGYAVSFPFPFCSGKVLRPMPVYVCIRLVIPLIFSIFMV